jgi:hypothetical protein
MIKAIHLPILVTQLAAHDIARRCQFLERRVNAVTSFRAITPGGKIY